MALSTKHLVRPAAPKWWIIEQLESIGLKRLMIGLMLFGIGCAIAYWMYPRLDDATIFDQQITDVWMDGREVVDAEDFFRNGGVYENVTDLKVDQEFVLPLVQRLKQEHQLNVIAILQEPKLAYAVLAEVPEERSQRNDIRRTVLEIDEKFPGLILQSWGHQWLSLIFLEEEELQPLRDAHALEAFEAANQRME